MILRKPYAFLIKHFRMVHVVLTLLAIYVCVKTNKLLEFFTSYLGEKLDPLEIYDSASRYVGFVLYLAVILILLMCFTMLILMKRKEKPYVLYISLSAFYLVLIIGFMFASSTLSSMEYTTVDIRVAAGLRDFIQACYIAQYLTITLMAVRATGFDIKKFDFGSDVKDFALNEDDDEEFDVALDLDTEDIKAKIRKRLRIINYIYKENKFAIMVLELIVISSLCIVGINKFLSRDIIYKEKESFRSYTYELTVLDSYSLVNDYRGTEIAKNKFYIAVRLKLKSIVSFDRTFNIENARINVKNKGVFLPVTDRYEYFQDLGMPYYGSTIGAGKEKNILLVYELPREYANLGFTFEYFKDQVENDYLYNKVSLNPKKQTSDRRIVDAALTEKLIFENSIYHDANITIMDVEFKNKYTYRFEVCKDGKCSASTRYLTPSADEGIPQTIMRLNYVLNVDNNLIGFKKGKFIENFGRIRYIVDDTEFSLPNKLKDITPFYVDGYSFVEIPERANRADKVYLDFKLRDKMYSYLLVDRTTEEN